MAWWPAVVACCAAAAHPVCGRDGVGVDRRQFPALRAHELGLVNVLAEPGDALDAAIVLAEKITANGPLAVAATKRIIVESRNWSARGAMERADQDPAAGLRFQRRAGRRPCVRGEAPAEMDRHLRRRCASI